MSKERLRLFKNISGITLNQILSDIKNIKCNSGIINLVCGIVFIGTNFWYGSEVLNADKNYYIGSDPAGYYQYLPAFFIHHNIINLIGDPVGNGNKINKYNCGVAILAAPIFYIQYQYTLFSGQHKEDFSPYYAKGLMLSGIIYLFLGLLMLFYYLKERFGTYTSLITLFLLYYATNLFYYSIAPGMSHVFSFFCFCGVLFYTDKAIRTNLLSCHLLNAFFIALVFLIRPINAPVIVFFVFYNIYSVREFKERVNYYLKNFHIPVLYILILLLIYLPQIIYWKLVTGNYVVYSYGYKNETFSYWASPRIANVLLGVQCGWLPYTPVMFFALVGLFIILFKKIHNGLSIGLTMTLILYIGASWWCNFSCALGYRSFVEYYPLLAVPFAYFIKNYLIEKSFVLTVLFVTGFVFFNLKITDHFLHYMWNMCDSSWDWDLYWKSIKYIFFG